MQGNKYHRAIEKLGVLIAEGWPNGSSHVRASTLRAVLLKANMRLTYMDLAMIIELLGVAHPTRSARDYKASDFCAAVRTYLDDPPNGQ